MSRSPGHCKLCEIEDFSDPDLRALIRSAYADIVTSDAFPDGLEYRKHWEVAMSLRALRDLGVIRDCAEILGVGAGAEATMFWLTNHVRRVFATDLYIDNVEWEGQAPPRMLVDPGAHTTCAWNPQRLVVQHMDALELRYDSASFDGIFSSSSIEHFGDYDAVRQAMAEMHRVLRPGGVASLSTEYRVAGSVSSLPGTLFFSEAELRSVLLDDGLWELAGPLDMSLSDATLRGTVEFAEAQADIKAGRPQWSSYPHIVLRHQVGVTFTSVHVALRAR